MPRSILRFVFLLGLFIGQRSFSQTLTPNPTPVSPSPPTTPIDPNQNQVNPLTNPGNPISNPGNPLTNPIVPNTSNTLQATIPLNNGIDNAGMPTTPTSITPNFSTPVPASSTINTTAPSTVSPVPSNTLSQPMGTPNKAINN